MRICLKCGRKRTEEGLDLLRPCPKCGTTLQEEIAIANKERMKEKDEIFEGLKADVYAGSISYDDISELQKRGIINKGQAAYLRRLWNEKWGQKSWNLKK